MSNDFNERCLTSLQLDILRREGYGENSKADKLAGDEYRNYENWHGRRLRGLLTTARRQSIVGSALMIGALALGVAGTVVPGMFPLSLPMLAVAAGGIVAGNTYLNIKLGDVRQASPSRIFSQNYRNKVASLEKAINELKNSKKFTSKRGQRKYAKLLRKEQKYVNKQYYVAVREWENILKKGDVRDFIEHPGTAGEDSYDITQLRSWGKVVNSLAQKQNEIIDAIPQDFLAENSKYQKYFQRKKFNITEQTLDDFNEEKKKRNRNSQPVRKIKSIINDQVEEVTKRNEKTSNKKTVLMEDKKLFEEYDKKKNKSKIKTTIQKAKRMLTRSKTDLQNDVNEEIKATKF